MSRGRIYWGTHLSSTPGSLVIPMLVIREPWTAVVQILDLERVLTVQLRKLLLDVRKDKGLNRVGRLRRDNTASTCGLSASIERVSNLTYRIENFPDTLAGITVFAPGP